MSNKLILKGYISSKQNEQIQERRKNRKDFTYYCPDWLWLPMLIFMMLGSIPVATLAGAFGAIAGTIAGIIVGVAHCILQGISYNLNDASIPIFRQDIMIFSWFGAIFVAAWSALYYIYRVLRWFDEQ